MQNFPDQKNPTWWDLDDTLIIWLFASHANFTGVLPLMLSAARTVRAPDSIVHCLPTE